MLVLFLIQTLFIVFFTLRITENDIEEQVEETSRVILFSLDRAIFPLIKGGNTASLKRILENIGANPMVKSLRIVAPGNMIIASNNPEENGIVIDSEIVRKIFAKNLLFLKDTNENKRSISYAIPVRGSSYDTRRKSDIIAVLQLTTDKNYYLAKFNSFTLSFLMSLLFIYSLLIFLVYMSIKHYVATPLKKLTGDIEKIKKGDYSIRPRIERPAEFALFSDALSETLEQLSQKNIELKKYSGKLEVMVSERTEKLEKSLEELKIVQNSLIQQEKMASIGRLSAGIAHEINNPMSFILSNFSTLKEYTDIFQEYYKFSRNLILSNIEKLTEKSLFENYTEKEDLEYIINDLADMLNELHSGGIRIKDIVQGLQDFARDEKGIMDLYDLNTGIENAIKIIWNKLKYKIDVEKKLVSLPPLYCNINQIEQVIINILSNAADSITDHGKITISSGLEDRYQFFIIKDTGKGISEEDKNKIFEPFFTRKETGSGTGLGLSISLGIIEKHGGRIEIESKEGIGTSFKVYIPAERREDE